MITCARTQLAIYDFLEMNCTNHPVVDQTIVCCSGCIVERQLDHDAESEKATLLQVDPISHKNTLRLLPIGKNNKQKVVGDDGGYLCSYDFQNGEPSPRSTSFDGPISCVSWWF